MAAYVSIISVEANAQQDPQPPWSLTAERTPRPRQSTSFGSVDGIAAAAGAGALVPLVAARAAAIAAGEPRWLLNSASVMSVNWWRDEARPRRLRVRGGLQT